MQRSGWVLSEFGRATALSTAPILADRAADDIATVAVVASRVLKFDGYRHSIPYGQLAGGGGTSNPRS